MLLCDDSELGGYKAAMACCSPIMVRLEFQGKHVVFRVVGRCPSFVIKRSNRAQILFKSSHKGSPEDGGETVWVKWGVEMKKRAIREVDMMGLCISKNSWSFAAVTSNPPNPRSI